MACFAPSAAVPSAPATGLLLGRFGALFRPRLLAVAGAPPSLCTFKKGYRFEGNVFGQKPPCSFSSCSTFIFLEPFSTRSPFLQQDMTYIVPNQDNLPHQNGPLLPSRPAPLGLAVGPLHKHTRPLPEKSVRHSTHQHRSCTHPLDSRCAPVCPPAHVTCDFFLFLLVSCTSKSATSQ